MAAPNEEKTLQALQTVQGFTADKIDGLITSEIGEYMLASFRAFAEAMGPDDNDDERAKKVHLMVLAYLMRCYVRGDID